MTGPGFGAAGYAPVQSMLDRAKNWVDDIAQGRSWGQVAHLLRTSDDVLDTVPRDLSTPHTKLLGTAIREAEASIYHPFIANHQTPVVNAFQKAGYNPKVHDTALQKLFQQNDLAALANPEQPFVDWGTYLGEHNTPAMRAAIAQMAKSLDQIPRELGFKGLPRYDVRSGTFFGQSLDAVGANASKVPGQPDSLMASFLKGHREKLAAGPEALNDIPVLSLFNSHVKQAAKQLAFQPFTQSPTGQITLSPNSLYNDIVKAANDPTVPKVQAAAQVVQNLLDGSRPTIPDNLMRAAYHGWAANAIVNNLKVAGNSLVDYATLLGINPKYQVLSAATNTPVKAEILRQANITSNAEYLGNMLGQDGGSFKVANYDITSKLESIFKQEAYFAKLLSEADKVGMTPEQILKPLTEAEKLQAHRIKGEAMKAVRQTQGYGSVFNSLMIRGVEGGSYLTFLQGAPITTSGTLLGMVKRAAEQLRVGDTQGATKSLGSLSYAMTVRTLLVGGRSVMDPKTAALMLEITSNMDTRDNPTLNAIHTNMMKSLTDIRDGRVTLVGGVQYTGFLQQLDNHYGTNLSSAVPSVVTTPANRLNQVYEIGKKFTKDSGKATVEAAGELANVGAALTPTWPIQPRLIFNAVDAASHIQEGAGGTRPYFGREIPVNPTGEVVSTFFGGPGPSGNTWQRRAGEADGQLRALQRFYQHQFTSGAWDPNKPPQDAVQLAKSYLDNYGELKYPNLSRAEMKKALLNDLYAPISAASLINEGVDIAEQIVKRQDTITEPQARAYAARIKEIVKSAKERDPELYKDLTVETLFDKATQRKERQLK